MVAFLGPGATAMATAFADVVLGARHQGANDVAAVVMNAVVLIAGHTFCSMGWPPMTPMIPAAVVSCAVIADA